MADVGPYFAVQRRVQIADLPQQRTGSPEAARIGHIQCEHAAPARAGSTHQRGGPAIAAIGVADRYRAIDVVAMLEALGVLIGRIVGQQQIAHMAQRGGRNACSMPSLAPAYTM
ncbi:hypothetical protein G6F60_014771 [Rhizopus arrhizus]|nr:hypothetical protein G6F60_014771 [Rhizopus arrhizus]